MKKYFYLCGLPRAGNTVFASLMNQNPQISVTANSLVCDMMGSVYRLQNLEVFHAFPDKKSFNNMMRNIIPNYYQDWAANYIIDRSGWGSQTSLEILKKYNPNKIKIIVLVRDVKEILASFIKFSYANKTNFIAKSGDTVEERCDYLMQKGGELDKWVEAVYNLTNTDNRKYIHLIEYDDLSKNPLAELDKVYDFLDIPRYEHQATKISQLRNNGMKYNDSGYGGELHKVKTDQIKKSDYAVTDYLPEHVSAKYWFENFWRQ